MCGLFCKKEEIRKYTYLPFQNTHTKDEPESNKVGYLPTKVDGEAGKEATCFQVTTFYIVLYIWKQSHFLDSLPGIKFSKDGWEN